MSDSNWDKIKNNIAELNGEIKLSPIDKNPLDNELIMCLFINKVNLKYRFEPYYEVPFLDYATRMFNTVIDNYENRKPEDIENFFDVAKKDTMIKTYIDSIKNVLITKLQIESRTNEDIKRSMDNILKEGSKNNRMQALNIIINRFDINLILCSALEFLDMRKYKILSKMLYNINKTYLDYAKESIINSNKNKTLDEIVYGINFNSSNTISTTNIKEGFNNNHINFVLIIILFILLIFITLKFG